jgi:hypothetical protein
VKKFVLHRIGIIVAAIAVGGAAIATDALARGGGGGHFGGAMGGGHIGRTGGEHFGGKRQHFGEHRGWAAPYGYYGDSGYYDPSTDAPDEQPTYPTTAYPYVSTEQPTYPTTAYPYVKPPRSNCGTQTYKVPSKDGGEASVKVVRC